MYHFYFVLFCIQGQIPSTSPPGGLYSEGRFNGGVLALRFWGAYIWGGSNMEGLIFGILRYLNYGPSFTYIGCFLVLRKLLLVSFCVVVWVLFSVFSIFCITSLVSATPRNHPYIVEGNQYPIIYDADQQNEASTNEIR